MELDAEGLESLKDLGLSLPGPHDIWLQYNLEHMFPAVDPGVQIFSDAILLLGAHTAEQSVVKKIYSDFKAMSIERIY